MNLNHREKHQIETIARECSLPEQEVEAFYVIERTQLERVAKVKTYVPLLAEKIVKEKLKHRNGE